MSIARIRALLIFGVLVLLAGIVVIWTLVQDARSEPTAQKCANPAVTKIPEPGAITVNVFNATSRIGLARQVEAQLKSAGFKVKSVGDDTVGVEADVTAELRFGAKGVGAAHLLRAYIPDAKRAFDPNRKDDIIDIAVGPKFEKLRDETEARQALINLPAASPPKGTC